MFKEGISTLRADFTEGSENTERKKKWKKFSETEKSRIEPAHFVGIGEKKVKYINN